jgi:hypothetical protein
MTQPVATVVAPEQARARAVPPGDKPKIPRRVTCPICATEFGPRATAGRCPVCGEQVVPEDVVRRKVPVLTPTWTWLKSGGWRVVVVLIVVAYQVALLAFVWHWLAAAHLL